VPLCPVSANRRASQLKQSRSCLVSCDTHMVLDHLRSLIAALVVRYLHRPRPLVIRAWLFVAAEADNLEDKRRCLHAVLQLDREN